MRALIVAMLLAPAAWADPFIVNDPTQAAVDPTNLPGHVVDRVDFELNGDIRRAVPNALVNHGDGTVSIRKDVDGFISGPITDVRVRYCDSQQVGDLGCSAWIGDETNTAAPLKVVQSPPFAPAGLRLAP